LGYQALKNQKKERERLAQLKLVNAPVIQVGSNKQEGWISISPWTLVWIHLMVPLTLAVVIVDYFFLQSSLHNSFSGLPAQYLLFSLIFIEPHIIASAVTLFDKKYMKHYRTKLLISIPAVLLFVFVGPIYLGMTPVIVVVSLFNIYHLFGQQFGIARMLLRVGGYKITVLKWLTLLTVSLIYYATYGSGELFVLIKDYVKVAALIGLIVIIILSHQLIRTSDQKVGKVYAWAGIALVSTFLILIHFEYLLIPLVMSRIIHDLTAYCFYCAHDHNRNQGQVFNWLHMPLMKVGIPGAVSVVIVSLVLAGVLTLNQENYWIYSLLMATGLFHYILEGYIWKFESIHRNYIKIKAV